MRQPHHTSFTSLSRWTHNLKSLKHGGQHCLAVIVAVSAIVATPASASTPDQIAITNAEDMEPIDGARWVVVSSMAGGTAKSGAIYLVDTGSGNAHRAYPAKASSAKSEFSCPGEVAPASFSPHGIATHTTPDGQTMLYVVNHGGRESVEIFDVVKGDVPSLRWKGCIVYPADTTGNGVSVTDDGTIYAARTKTLEGAGSEPDMSGDIIFWRSGEGWQTVPGSQMMGPNGVVASPDGEDIFANAWPSSTLVAVNQESGRRQDLTLPFMPDNIKWSDRATLLVTGHRAPIHDIISCYISPRMSCDIPASFAEIDPDTLTILAVTDLESDFATTAVDVGETCWLGTARGEIITRLPKPCSSGKAEETE